MLGKIKFILAGAIGIIVALFAANHAGKRSKANEIKAQTTEKKAQIQREADKAIYAGLKRDQEIRNEDNTDKSAARNFFE
jgi:hypothetical protein